MKRVKLLKPFKHTDLTTIIEQELKEFLGIFVVLSDDDSTADYIISVGDNELSQKHGLKSKQYLGRAYSIITKDNIYFILSNSDEGLLFGVYRLMHELIGFETYANDEIFISDSIDFKNINLECVADIPYASRSWMSDKYNNLYPYRLGYALPHWLVENFHSFVTYIMPKEKYFKDHPEWYSYPSTRQLCLTNEDMTKEFTKNVISYLNDKNLQQGGTYILRLGHEDNTLYCQCDKCKASDAKYKRSGTLIRFINKVAKEVNKYKDEHYPDKHIKLETFGYSYTIEPPVDENFKPLDESVVVEPNVGIFYANMAPYWDNRYEDYMNKLKGWSSIGAEMYIWLYDSLFDNEFIYLSTLKNTQRIFQELVKAKTMYLEDMGHYLANVSFDAWSNYVRAKLSWDVNTDIDLLTDDFFKHYFKEASVEVKQYFDEINEYENEMKGFTRHLFIIATYQFKEPTTWKKEKLVEWIDLLSSAIKKVDKKVGLRVRRERLTPLFLYLEIYGYGSDKETLQKYIDMVESDCADNNIVYIAEHGPEFSVDLETRLAFWRSLL